MPKPEPSAAEIDRAFRAVVNMTAAELARWLETEESRAVGWKPEGAAESVGHAAGGAIVRILKAKPAARTEAELKLMRKTIGFIRRHLAQRPFGDVSRTRWRYALMNWGHDPVKDRPI